MKQVVYAFDFDGTLTRSDTFVAFIRFVHGRWRTTWGFALFAPMLMLMKLRLYPNWKAKQRVFAWFFRGMELSRFDGYCRDFAVMKARLLRPKMVALLEQALADGARVIVVSASIENWVRPFFARYGERVMVSCTRIDVREEVVTGKFLTKNCYGREKVKRIERAFPHRNTYHLVAFGDSAGDDAMLAYADEGYKGRKSAAHFSKSEHRCMENREQDVKDGNRKKAFIGEALRFAVVGVAATLIQVGIYNLLVGRMNYALSNTVAYAVSFLFNYVASTRFTFKVRSTARRGAGFAFSHVVNYLLQTVLLAFFIHLGMNERLAQLPMFAVCVPVNFLLVRFFMKK